MAVLADICQPHCTGGDAAVVIAGLIVLAFVASWMFRG